MFDADEMAEAVSLQGRCYLLLRWMADAVKAGFISFEAAHTYASLEEAAAGWIEKHYVDIPAAARPPREHLPAFAAFFSTYMTNSFDLVSDPGKRLYSPEAHCFCPLCSWLVDVPNLQPKRLTPAHKRKAHRLRIKSVEGIAMEAGLLLPTELAEEIAKDSTLREACSLVAYGEDLLVRRRGVANGPAVLALWRGFAWTQTGSPKRKFVLRAEDILAAEAKLRSVIAERLAASLDASA